MVLASVVGIKNEVSRYEGSKGSMVGDGVFRSWELKVRGTFKGDLTPGPSVPACPIETIVATWHEVIRLSGCRPSPQD